MITSAQAIIMVAQGKVKIKEGRYGYIRILDSDDNHIGSICGTWSWRSGARNYLAKHPASKYWDQIANLLNNRVLFTIKEE